MTKKGKNSFKNCYNLCFSRWSNSLIFSNVYISKIYFNFKIPIVLKGIFWRNSNVLYVDWESNYECTGLSKVMKPVSLKYVGFIVCKLCLNKVDLKNNFKNSTPGRLNQSLG